MSKFDRFLVSDSFLYSFSGVFVVVLDKFIPNHRPILLKENVVDYSPTPFRFFNSWLEMEDFHDLAIATWKNDGIVEVNGLVAFNKKLQNLKSVIRKWSSSSCAKNQVEKNQHIACISPIDLLVDQGVSSCDDLNRRKEAINCLVAISNIEAKYLAQKAKIKCVVEGDENTKFFHGMIKKNVDKWWLKVS